MREPRVPEVRARDRVDRLVLAEHHAAQQRRLGGGHPRGHATLGPAAGAVERAREPAPPGAGRAQPVHEQLRGDAPSAQLPGRRAGRRGEPPRHAQLGTRVEPGRQRRPGGPAQEHAHAVQAPGRERGLRG
jgi:hypothetical protein